MQTSPPTTWRRSSRCSQSTCLEVATGGTNDDVMIRDSKAEAGPTLTFGRDTWNAFVTAVKNDEIGQP